ncbi:uncharacterized protein BT62DRAFT_1081381 [Guyanagaster necrorhizus]|uniref:Uncharacterized protein n=1 Tax=Guyanagaster necrorhizus TaxID=856835 RepID=A0A9P7VGK6_9AGAR|nr:uncharacterized protein BT62DRAFT_1081381 [Guyanagaster necrorhizus MCA 3950]KAG7439736.1 hypothetical protein BT62DRAFT_1081381 [Guyanagaster necrorhizus MCA 3950]
MGPRGGDRDNVDLFLVFNSHYYNAISDFYSPYYNIQAAIFTYQKTLSSAEILYYFYGFGGVTCDLTDEFLDSSVAGLEGRRKSSACLFLGMRRQVDGAVTRDADENLSPSRALGCAADALLSRMLESPLVPLNRLRRTRSSFPRVLWSR